jgi:hypothetical protein
MLSLSHFPESHVNLVYVLVLYDLIFRYLKICSVFYVSSVDAFQFAARMVMTERKDSGPIRPCHIREAYRRLKLEGKVPKKSVPRLF